ncbi:MAG: hypothetical protein Q9169_004350 [Polycauliona sp. 2 TL-2023]
MVSFSVIQYLLVFADTFSLVQSAAVPFYTAAGSGHLSKRYNEWPLQIAESVINSSWPGFEEKITRWSTFAAPTFNAVFIPQCEADLAVGVNNINLPSPWNEAKDLQLNYLSSQNKTWLVKSGGHGYSTTLSTVQNAVMINMERFKYAYMRPDNTLIVGSGATIQDTTGPMYDAGREITIGACPCVGAMGVMLGGGVGRLQGKHGLASDAIQKVRLALYNGTIVEASKDVNPDLFWGIRGAGQNFGVVIEATLETYPRTNGGDFYNADMIITGEQLGPVIDAMNSLYPIDDNLALLIFYVVNATTLEPAVALNLVYSGPEEDGKRYTELFSPFSTSLDESILPWVDLNSKSGGGAVLAKCVPGQSHDQYDSITKTVDKATFLELFESFGSFVAEHPALVNSTVILEIFAQQGISGYPQNFSAFPHRGSVDTLVEIEMAYVDQSVTEIADNWAREWRDRLSSPEVSGYDRMIIYQNYGHGDEPITALYGYEQWRHERLTNLKRTYDPRGQFNAYHAIPATLDGWSS